MRITLKLILSLMVVIGAVALGFSFWQARTEEVRLKNELERRANIVAENLKESIQPYITLSNLQKPFDYNFDKFTKREHILGVAIHDTQGVLVATSKDIESTLTLNPKVIFGNLQQVEKTSSEYGKFINLDKKPVHAYSVNLPLDDTHKYTLTIFNDAFYIQERVMRIWLNSFLRGLIQALCAALTALIIIYLNVMAPIQKTTEWIKKIRLGESPGKLNPKEQTLLGPLAKEISKMAKSLEMARLSAEEEARLRQSTESLWTAERLKEFVRTKLEGRPLFVVSNREPYMHVKKGKETECIVPASGMVTAIEPVLKACGGTWVAHGAGDADREVVDNQDRVKVPPEEPQYILRRVWITKSEEEGYYYGFANEGLWPLCHIAHTRPIFRESNWFDYKAVNEKFAQATLQELEGTEEPCVLIQDYHFALLPALIKKRRPDARVAIFWHIPWPNPESFGICPWQKELLEGMLGADIIGFHTQFHCNNFIETVDRFLECRVDYEHFTITREGQTTWIKPFPISIAFTGISQNGETNTQNADENKQALLKPYNLQAEFMGVGVDRLDYTKGILERFWSVENFLEKNPKYIGRFTFVELGAPSRTAIPKYQEFVAELERETERINNRFKAKNWKAILLLMKHHSHKDIYPFYRYSDFCLVTSLHDGMNLVAKEYVSTREDDRGVLILSKFTGAARELPDALIVNPYDIGETAEAIRTAVEMPVREQERRMKVMREIVKDRNIYRWAADLVSELARLRIERV